MVSGKSLPKSLLSSCANACLAIPMKGCQHDAIQATATASHTFESLLNIHSFLCTCLEVWYATFRIAERLRALCRDLKTVSRIPCMIETNIPSACSPQHQSCFPAQPGTCQSCAQDACSASYLTNGKFSGSDGLACIRNSSLQLSRVSKLLLFVTSKHNTQQSAPL